MTTCTDINGCKRKATRIIAHPRFTKPCFMCDSHAVEFHRQCIANGLSQATLANYSEKE